MARAVRGREALAQDLGDPLQVVQATLEVLERRHRAKLDPQAAELLAMAKENAARMHRLVREAAAGARERSRARAGLARRARELV